MSQFTIIVPIFQTPGILQLFLDSLVQTLEADTDLIFINDGSGTSVQNILEHFRERHAQTLVVQNHLSQGAARAINLGLQRVNPSCEYVVFLDSDTILQEGWQSRLRMCFSTPEIGAVGGMLLYPQSGGVQCCGITYSGSVGKHVYLNANPEHFPLQHPFEVQASVFAFCCIRHNVVEKLGLLDEEFYNGYEDLDYQFRMRKLGYHIFTDPAIRLYHWEKSNGSHRSYNRKSNLGRFWQKHGEFVQSDLTQFLQLCLDGQLHSAGPYNAIDFCEGRSDAVRVRDWIDTTSGMT